MQSKQFDQTTKFYCLAKREQPTVPVRDGVLLVAACWTWMAGLAMRECLVEHDRAREARAANSGLHLQMAAREPDKMDDGDAKEGSTSDVLAISLSQAALTSLLQRD
jgi:hypothetical protein